MENHLGQNSFPPLGSVDKTRVLSVKPLRTLVPVFTSPPSDSGTSSTPQGGAPFVCVPPTGPFPPGYAPFFPFVITPESQRAAGAAQQNQQTPTGRRRAIAAAVPINSFRTPDATANGDVDEDGYEDEQLELDVEDASQGTRIMTKYLRSTSGRRERIAGAEANIESEVKDVLATINPMVLTALRESDGGRDAVIYTLMIYEVLRRRITQLEERRRTSVVVAKRPDLRAGTIMMTKGIRANKEKRNGALPGVEIGDIFFFRFELCLVGLHAPSMAGIDYKGKEEPLAVSIVSSGGYEDNVEDDSNVLIYTGQGGTSRYKDAQDQKLERGNLALEKSLHKGNEVRVIRGIRDLANPTGKVYVYDGLYKTEDSWVEKGKSGFNVFKYRLVRLPGQSEAYLIWKSIEQWRQNPTSRVGVILPDLTSGEEKLPVCLVNDVDNEKGPAYFTYYPTLKISKLIGPIEPSTGCACVGGCQPGRIKCSCLQKNGGYLPYFSNGVLMNLKSVIYECGPSCQCPPNCRNRITHGGVKIRLEVFRTKGKGWGLRSWDPIRAGAFICEYAGEVIDNARVEELSSESEDDYIFYSTRIYQQLEVFPSDTEAPKIPYPLYISAKNIGNVARFMNHSCSPTVFWRPVLRENHNESDLHVAFHAVRHIPPLTELTYDYGTVLPLTAGQKKKKCLCGSVKCRGYFC